MNLKQLYSILKTSFKDWLEDNATLRAAALTFFIILPLPTLLLILEAVFALFIGQSQATQVLMKQITAVTGPAVAALFKDLILNTDSPFTSVWTAIIVVGFSIGGAIGTFSVLRDIMNRIWEVKTPKGLPLKKRIRKTILPFIIASVLGIIVIAWTAIIGNAFSMSLLSSINGPALLIIFTVAQMALSFVIVTPLLAVIYKIVPEAKVHWNDVIIASIITGIIFTIANYIFGIYAQTFTITTVIGNAGTLLMILLWIFVLNQTILYGAEVSKVYASTIGKHAEKHVPESVKEAAEPIEEAGRKIEDAAKGDVIDTGKPRVKSEKQKTPDEDVE